MSVDWLWLITSFIFFKNDVVCHIFHNLNNGNNGVLIYLTCSVIASLWSLKHIKDKEVEP